MKRTLVTLLLAAATFTLSAQEKPTPKKRSNTSFGIQAGANATKFTGKSYDGSKLDHDFIVGYHVGINFDIPLASNLFIQPGIRYSAKGTKNSSPSVLGGNATSTVKVRYAEIPLYFLYKAPAGPGRLLFGIGGTVSYGIGGTWKQDENGTQLDDDGVVKFKNSYRLSDPNQDKDFYLKPWDASVGALIGFQFGQRFTVQFNGNYGLINIAPKIEDIPDDQENAKNLSFGITMAYRIPFKN